MKCVFGKISYSEKNEYSIYPTGPKKKNIFLSCTFLGSHKLMSLGGGGIQLYENKNKIYKNKKRCYHRKKSTILFLKLFKQNNKNCN
jgi:hypothetical protein